MPLLHGLGFVGALGYGLLAWLNRPGHPLPLGAYYAVLGLSWIVLGSAVWTLLRHRSPRSALLPIFLWALVFRAVGFAAHPVLEDDFYRYLWDGRQLALSGDPYATCPKDHFEDSELDPTFESILSRINYPHLPTIYAPVLQYLFAAAYWLSPGELWALKALLLTADVVAGLLLFRLAGIRALLLYSWCPLLIQETAFTAHPDLLGVMFMVAAWQRREKAAPLGLGIFLGLAVGTKITGAAIAPFLLKGQPLRAWTAAAAAWVAVYLPFWLQGSWADWKGLSVFAREWEFNSGGFAILSAAVGQTAAGPMAMCLILLPLAWLWGRTDPTKLPRGDWVFGWFFAWSAVVQPWYLLWLLPWVAVFPSWAGITALVSVSLSYVTWLHLGADHPDPFAHPWWVRPVEYGLVLLTFGIGIWRAGGVKATMSLLAPSPRPPEADEK